MTELNSMYADFIKAQKEFEPARKTSNNPFHKSKYADLSACIDAVKEGLNNNNFSLIQINHECDSGVAIETRLYHSSGEYISSGILRLPAAKQDPQGLGSCMTYARRYSLMAVCGIAPEDDDANATLGSDKYGVPRQPSNPKPLADLVTELDQECKDFLKIEASNKAKEGMVKLTDWFKSLSKIDQNYIKPLMEEPKRVAEAADKEKIS